VDSIVTYTAVLDVREDTVYFLARLLMLRRIELGTRRGRRALGCYRQAVLVIRWFLDGTRVAQLAVDNGIGKSTAYDYLHEGINALAGCAPHLSEAMTAAKATGCGHLNLDGTVIRTGRSSHPGPNGADLWWSGKHKHHGGNIQVLSDPTGWPVKKVKGVEPTDSQKQYNLIVRGVHGVAERANSLLKTTFKALRRVSVCPWRIGAITKAALVLLHLEHGRPLPARHTA
jgi:hypothetical protein